jgi:hypothetical protein
VNDSLSDGLYDTSTTAASGVGPSANLFAKVARLPLEMVPHVETGTVLATRRGQEVGSNA